MMQYGVHPFRDEGCTTCEFYRHTSARCNHGIPANAPSDSGPWVGIGLSPCAHWIKGFEFIPDSWGNFRRIGIAAPDETVAP